VPATPHPDSAGAPSTDIFHDDNWYLALGVSERAALAAAVPPPPTQADAPDRERAARRLSRWRAQAPFADDRIFARRLAADGLDEAALLALLGEPPESLAARAAHACRPAWLVELEAAFGAPRTEHFPFAEVNAASRQSAFLEIARPLLEAAWARLLAALGRLATAGMPATAGAPAPPHSLHPLHAAPLFEPVATARLLAGALPSRLLFLLGRTLAVELHVAGQDGRLAGETPEERYACFVDQLRQPEVALPLLCRYPVLARQLVDMVTDWVDASVEMVSHLVADAAALADLLSPAAGLGTLCDLRTGLGDLHRGGRTVTRLTFDSGLSVIYKPRSMAIEAAFQDLLDWTVAKGFAPSFRRLPVLAVGDHGWSEVVVAAPCATAGEVERFYLRQGGFLALLYVLSATDMHHENLIAAGEHPFLVDLEALFHPLDQRWGREIKGTPVPDTVLRVGLLPAAGWGGEGEKDGIDLSAMTATAGQMVPQPVLGITDAGTDRMRFQLRQVEYPMGGHLPTLDGAEVPLGPYVDAVVAGFDRMLRLLVEHRDELLAPAAAGGPLAAMADHPVRVLVRLTMAYGNVLIDGQHPFVLGDAVDKDRLLDRLWSAASEFPALERVVAAERRDLQRGDIPMFTTTPGSRDLRTARGEAIAGLLDDTGLARVESRLRGLDDSEMARQTWIVRNALLGAAGVGAGGRLETRDYDLRETAAAPPSGELLAAADDVGRYLDRLAFRSGAGAFWYGPDIQGSTPRWVIGPTGPDLHLGQAGIALFLAHLGALSGDRKYTDLARAAAVTMAEQASPEATLLSTVGAFSGWGGVVYALTHLGVLWGDETLLDQAAAVAETLAPHIETDELCDVVGGAAGCLACLLGLWEMRPADRLLELAVRCGERLQARALPMDRGLGWVLEIAGPRPLAGFSHGAAGISWALLRLAAAAGDSRFRDTALAALEYERSLYCPDAANWPDLRAGSQRPDGEPHFLCAWCHGAAGIALGRLDSLARLDGDARAIVREEAETALATTLATGFGRGHSLCHGDLGNLEALTLAADALGEPLWAARAGSIAGGILADIQRQGRQSTGWRTGIASSAEAPGLMVGMAGIGYGLLRLASPRTVPSVLRLASPRIR
jgi:type 2 lantibiotic biosynthesis protein LanM